MATLVTRNLFGRAAVLSYDEEISDDCLVTLGCMFSFIQLVVDLSVLITQQKRIGI